MTLDDRVLDPTAWKILQLLQEDARRSFTDIGREVGLSSPAVAERVRRLEHSGIIVGYHAAVSTEKLGLPVTAFIRAAGERALGIGALAVEIPEVLECHRVTGTDNYILKVVVASVAHLQRLIDQLAPYGQLTTSIVLSSPLTRRVIREM